MTDFAQCPGCGQHLDATTRLHEVRRRLANETSRADDLERGLKEIVFALTQRQPMPRTSSVSYVAGYARAMDDMKQIIVETVEKHAVPPRTAGAVEWVEGILGHPLEPWQRDLIANLPVATSVATSDAQPVAPGGAPSQVGAAPRHESPQDASPGGDF